MTYNWLLVQLALAKPIQSRSTNKLYEDIKWIAEDTASRLDGVWSDDKEYIERNSRQVTYHGDLDYSPSKCLDASLGHETPMKAILEHVFSASYVVLYVYKLKTAIKM